MKKFFTTFIFALLMIGAVAQSQISELSKNLIFRWEGSENFPDIDLVSGARSTNTATYNVLGKDGSGRRYLENINTSYSSIPDAAQYDFGTGDFTLIASFTPANITDNGKYLISKEAGGIGYGIYQEDNDIWIRFDDNTTDVSAIIGTDILVAGTKITCEVVFTRAGNAVLYLNSSASSSGTVAISTASLTLDNTGAFVVGNIEAHNQGFTGQIHFTRAFNFALTSTKITNYPKPEYPIEASDRDGAGNLCVLDLNASGISASTPIYWYDRTNSTAPSYTSVAATNTDCTLVIPPASNLKGMYFNGTTSKIVLTGVPTSALAATDRTISCWIRPQINNAWQHIITYGTTAAEGRCYVRMFVDGRVIFGNELLDIVSNTYLQPNTNYNVLITFSNGISKIYVNGVLDQIGAITLNTILGNVYIGASFADGLRFNGNIWNANIWSRILDESQIKLVYDTGF